MNFSKLYHTVVGLYKLKIILLIGLGFLLYLAVDVAFYSVDKTIPEDERRNPVSKNIGFINNESWAWENSYKCPYRRVYGTNAGEMSSSGTSINFPDVSYFYEISETELLLFEDFGAGTIQRMFFAFSGQDRPPNFVNDYKVRFTRDGEVVFEKLIESLGDGELFGGPPVAGSPLPSKDKTSGFYAYGPFPYKNHMKITFAAPTNSPLNVSQLSKEISFCRTPPGAPCPYSSFFDIVYEHHVGDSIQYENQSEINHKKFQVFTKFSEVNRSDSINTILEKTEYSKPIDPSLCILRRETASVAPGRDMRLFYLNVGHPSLIQSLIVEAEKFPEQFWRDMWIYIYFDDLIEPSIVSPLGGFFGDFNGTFEYEARGFFVGTIPSNKTGYCYYPMPFRDRIIIGLRNKSPTVNYQKFTIDICWRQMTTEEATGEWGYFNAHYHAEEPTSLNGDFQVLRRSNSWGNLVGINMRSYNLDFPEDQQSNTIIEGDVKIFLDGSQTPQILDTGVEDWYNAAHFFRFIPQGWGIASHGVLKVKMPDFQMYRQHVFDPIRWRKSISFRWVHGSWVLGGELALGENIQTANWYSVVFFYEGFENIPKKTAFLDINKPQSLEESDYSTTGTKREYNDCAKSFLGDVGSLHTMTPVCEISSNILKKGDKTKFHVKLDTHPDVLLRKRFDGSIPNQRATIFVNDEEVGIWNVPGYYGEEVRFRDSDFLFKNFYPNQTVNVTIVVNSTTWSEISYTVLS